MTSGECGIFEDGDPIRWDGEEVLRPITREFARELELDTLSIIQVWGAPLVGFEPFSRAPQDAWWIWRIFTTFHEGPHPLGHPPARCGTALTDAGHLWRCQRSHKY